jgi:hypothetical protein
MRATPEQFPGASDLQIQILQMVINAVEIYDFRIAAESTTNASTYLLNEIGYVYGNAIPNDQWVHEITTWDRWGWAAMQTYISDFAVGYGVQEPDLGRLLNSSLSDTEKQLCQLQRRVKTGGLV